MVLTVKNLPAMQETQVQFLSWDDPLKKGIATHSSIIAWKIPQTEEPDGLQFLQLQRVDRTEQLLLSSLLLAYKVFFFFLIIQHCYILLNAISSFTEKIT